MHHHHLEKEHDPFVNRTIETDSIQPVKDFVRDSKFLVNRCTKPDKKGRIQTGCPNQ